LIITEQRRLIMELGLSWVFLVTIWKDNLWKRSDTECVSGHDWEENWLCVTVTWPSLSVFAGVHCEVQLMDTGRGLV
jgi:hypothetical protein